MVVVGIIDEIEGILILLGAKPNPKVLKALEIHSPEALTAMLEDLKEEFETKTGKKLLTVNC